MLKEIEVQIKSPILLLKMMGSRDLSLSKSVGRSVPIPHTPHIPCSKVSSQGIKAQDLLSAQSHLVGQDRQPWHQFQHNQSLANLARDAKDHGDRRDWHPSAGHPPAPSKIKGWRRVLVIIHEGFL